MQFNLSIDSFNVNNTAKNNPDFKKYDIDVALNELTNNENSCTLKYGYKFSSMPKGIHLVLEGTIMLNGTPSEFERIYQKDEQGIPNILRQSYHELYPVLFMISKSMNIPCPPYEISETMESHPDSNDTSLDSISEDVPEIISEEQLPENPFESSTTEELTEMQIKLTKENSEKPSEELKNKLELITETLNKKIKESVMSTQNVS